MPLAATSLACVLVGAAIPFTPIGHLLGFTPLPPLFFAALAAMVVTYLVLVEIAKTLSYRRHLTGRPLAVPVGGPEPVVPRWATRWTHPRRGWAT